MPRSRPPRPNPTSVWTTSGCAWRTWTRPWPSSSAGAPASRWSRAPSVRESGSPSSRRQTTSASSSSSGARPGTLAPLEGLMIYMVEMALLDTARRAEWDAWYVAHQHRLLSIPGFRASQRFEAIHAAECPFVALHEVDSPEIFTTPAYQGNAGPRNTGEWQARMGNWHRNLFAGADHTPDVPTDARLVVVEEDGGPALPGHVSVRWMEAVGLDRSV